MRLITKIKRKDERISITYQETRKDGKGLDEFSLTSHDRAVPSFYRALQKLAAHVVEVCEIDTGYEDGMVVTGLSISYQGDDDRMGAVITAQKELSCSPAPLILNTPYLVAYSTLSKEVLNVMGEKMTSEVSAMISEAKGYIDGERAQGDLFAAAEKAAQKLRDSIPDDLEVSMGIEGGNMVNVKTGEVTGKAEKTKRLPDPPRGTAGRIPLSRAGNSRGCDNDMIYFDGIHLAADSLEELHRIARKIGLKREWFQDKKIPHYDVFGQPKEILFALLREAGGASLVSPRELIRRVKP